jgi:hypothetical protein
MGRTTKNRDADENVKRHTRTIDRPKPDRRRYEREITDYFERRHARLNVVATTTTPRGQTLDWIPIESQVESGTIAEPPPDPEQPPEHAITRRGKHKERLAALELAAKGVEKGPDGTVPILRKRLEEIPFTRPLRQYLSKSQGQPVVSRNGLGIALPADGGSHRYAYSGQSVGAWGGEGVLSCFDPYVESPDDFSLIQIGLSNSDLGFKQTVEAGWQEYKGITGDWVPHLFLYYTTNGYTGDGDGKGGYNTDVDGWVQYDDAIFPGTTFVPYSTRGGDQRVISIKFQHYQDNWWLRCQDRWVGYYPGSLFMGNQSVFSTLGDHADHIGFWGEVADSDTVSGRTTTDMGSGYWPEAGWTRSAYMHNLRYQSDRGGTMADYDGSSGRWASDPDMYDIETHFNSGSNWGSYVYVGGPGAG